MPELPEVETVARTLSPLVSGRTVTGVQVLHPTVWQGSRKPEALVGQRITGTGRRAKLLLVRFEPPTSLQLLFHLKMTGRVFVYPEGTAPGRHTRLILDLDDGNRLFFDDMRTFGYARAMSGSDLDEWEFWRNLGPEPLVITAPEFGALLAGRKRALKSLLLDQTIIAGIGNIYADESLFRAGIHPGRSAASLPPERLEALHGHVVDVLEESIEACGSSIRDYRTARGDAGAFQNAFRVYGRAGKACTACGTTLDKGLVAGRTTVWCPRCQA